LHKGNVLVIGGGPCGSSAAWEIARGGYDVTLIEPREHLGGLASHNIFNGNVYEFGTHVFHTDQIELLKQV
jgi:protoporphyrinogen oxidase